MKAALRQALDRAFVPIYARLDSLADLDRHLAVLHGQLSARLDELTRRIESLERTLETMEDRTATVTERQADYEEDQLQLGRRMNGIEELLAEGQP